MPYTRYKPELWCRCRLARCRRCAGSWRRLWSPPPPPRARPSGGTTRPRPPSPSSRTSAPCSTTVSPATSSYSWLQSRDVWQVIAIAVRLHFLLHTTVARRTCTCILVWGASGIFALVSRLSPVHWSEQTDGNWISPRRRVTCQPSSQLSLHHARHSDVTTALHITLASNTNIPKICCR